MITIRCDFCKKLVGHNENGNEYTRVPLEATKCKLRTLDICNECVEKLLTKYYVA